MSGIDAAAFLSAAFGHHDCDSGYGAVQPRSRDIRTFFEGRYGQRLPTSETIQRPYKSERGVIQSEWRPAAVGIANDLEELARQIKAMCPEETKPEDRT